MDKALRNTLTITDPFDIFKGIQLLYTVHHRKALLRAELPAVCGINFVSIVLAGIVAGRDHDAAVRF